MLQPTVSHVVAIGSRPMANAGVHVDQRRKKEPAFAGPDVGQVREPYLVRRGRGEVPAQPVRRDRVVVPAVGRANAARDGGQPAQARKPHEARDTVSSDLPAGSPQRRMDARRAIAPATLGMSLVDVVQKRAVLDAALALRPSAPRVVATDGDAEHGADRANEVTISLLFNQLKQCHSLIGHRYLRLWSRVLQPEPLPKIDGGRQRHHRPRAALRRGLRARPLTPSVGTLPPFYEEL